MVPMRFTDAARRARIARRHGLHPDFRVADPLAAARAMVALHATEAPSVHLAVAARCETATPADVEQALYADRSIVKQLAMRRTLFAFPRELLGAALGSASARVATAEHARLVKDVERHQVATDGTAWVERASAAVLERLADGSALSAQQLREELPELAGRTTVGPDAKKWEVAYPLGPRVLTLLGAQGRLVRATNAGHWRTSRPLWTRTEHWLGELPAHAEPRAGYASLVEGWLRSFGPGTTDDLVWWFGATKSAIRTALSDVGAVPVELESGQTGLVLSGDEQPDADPGPWCALLPVLDPTTMGWRHRDFYLDPAHTRFLFDSNGNGGTTAWLDGRIVGCWVQDEDARVRVVPTAPLGKRQLARLDAEAERLTAFLDGVVISSVYKSQRMRGVALP